MAEAAQIYVWGKRRRPTPDDADWPRPSPRKRARDSSLNPPCALCTLMFSPKGLEYLNSPNGFRHWTRAECQASGNESCRVCKFIFLVVCKEYDENWGHDDRLIFRNFQSTNLKTPVSGSQSPAIYGLKGSLESEADKCIITIYPFAKKGKNS